MRRLTCAIAIGLLAGGAARGAGVLELSRGGKSEAAVYVLQAETNALESAQECARLLGLMSGAEIAVKPVAGRAEVPDGKPALVLGGLASQLGLALGARSRAGDAYRYKVEGGRVLFVSESPRGLFLAVCRFFEGLGCGWYVPGPLGEVIPRLDSVRVDDTLDYSGLSNSIYRRFWYGGKNGLGASTELWVRRMNGNLLIGSWRHAWSSLVPKELFAEHPEYFAVKRGQRGPGQLCTSNPEVVRTAAASLVRMMNGSDALVFPAGPNDGGGLCECAACAKLDTPGYVEPSSGKPACSDRVFGFANDVAALTAKEFPDRDLGILVYSEYSRVPKKFEKLHPNVFPMIAPIRRCRLHAPGNPNCPWNQLWEEEIRGWAAMGKKLGFYIYNYNLADAMAPLSKISVYRDLAKLVNELGVEQLAWEFETIDAWSAYAPHLYLSARLAWDSRLDVDAEMDRFFTGFYGAAAAPMRRYWLRIDKAYADTPAHTGSQYGLHHVWSPDLLAKSRADMGEAAALAANPREKRAVAMAEAGLRCIELFMDIYAAKGQFDFARAAEIQAALEKHVAAMAAETEPCWAHDRYTWGYYKRFSSGPVTAGADIVRKGGRILARMPDRWAFRTDEAARGVAEGWFKPDAPTNGWGEAGTWSQSWADLGLGFYQGDAWYRTTFAMPAFDKGADLRLWFGGFDENVEAYLNGELLGELKGFAKPNEFTNVVAHLRSGVANVLAVRVSAGGLAEMGTGGIMEPVMVYQAGGAEAAPAAPVPPAGKDGRYEM